MTNNRHNNTLHWQIIGAVICALIAGSITHTSPQLHDILSHIYHTVGTLFLNALKMLVVPLILSAIISGICDIGQREGFGRMGVKVICYYMITSLVAILTGLMFVNLFQPGRGIDITGSADNTLTSIRHHGFMDIVNILIRIIPPNIVKAASDNEMLGLIFFWNLVWLLHKFSSRRACHDTKTILGRCI
jgi:DAACS family dicarboxylate/amino acid:cation (Na+ or H+) symporter